MFTPGAEAHMPCSIKMIIKSMYNKANHTQFDVHPCPQSRLALLADEARARG